MVNLAWHYCHEACFEIRHSLYNLNTFRGGNFQTANIVTSLIKQLNSIWHLAGRKPSFGEKRFITLYFQTGLDSRENYITIPANALPIGRSSSPRKRTNMEKGPWPSTPQRRCTYGDPKSVFLFIHFHMQHFQF